MTDNSTYRAYKGDLMRYIEHRTQTDPAFAIERLRSAEAHLEASWQREATLAAALAQAQAERDALVERMRGHVEWLKAKE